MISAVILTKNSARTLDKTLASLTFLDEIVVVDTGSCDATLEIAQSYPNVQIFHREFSHFGRLRNLSSSFAKNDWILSIDSDEVLSEPLQAELRFLVLEDTCIYGLIRENYFHGKKITCCGWNREKRLRLYHRKKTRFREEYVHESLEQRSYVTRYLQGPLLHFPFPDEGHTEQDLLEKLQHYTDLYAEQNRGKPASYKKAVFHGFWSFLRAYLLQRGILFGRRGWIISVYKGLSSYYKYAKLAEKNQENKGSRM